MARVYVTRRERFNAAHKLWNPKWSEEKNLDVFGKCANTNWHGHNYDLYVTVKGTPDEDTGCVIDLKILSVLIKEKITAHLDHRNLNLDVPFLVNVMPSTENLAVAIWNQLNPHLAPFACELHCIKLYETENNYAEYFGE